MTATDVDLTSIRWRWYKFTGFAIAEVGDYTIHALTWDRIVYLLRDGEYLACGVSIPEWMAKSIPEFRPGLLFDWLQEEMKIG